MNDIISFFFSLSEIQLAVGIAMTAAIVAIVISWRLAAISLFLQYVLVGLLLNTVLPGRLGIVQIVTGLFTSVILYWTARRIEDALDVVPDGRMWFVKNRDVYPMGLPFRFLALIFATLVLLQLPASFRAQPYFAESNPFPIEFVVPAFWLLAMGVLTIILTRDPIKTGMGLLTFQNGFLLLYMLVQVSIVTFGLLAIASIVLSLVAGYLAVARHLPMIEAYHASLEPLDPASPEALAEAVAALEQPAQHALPAETEQTNGVTV